MLQPICIYVDIRNPSLKRVVLLQRGVTLRDFQKYFVLHDVYVQLLMPLSFAKGVQHAKKAKTILQSEKVACMLLDQTNYSCKALKQYFCDTTMNINNSLS